MTSLYDSDPAAAIQAAAKQFLRERIAYLEVNLIESQKENKRLQQQVTEERAHTLSNRSIAYIQMEQDFLTLKKEKNSFQILLEMERGQVELLEGKNRELQATLDDIQAVAIEPLMVEVNRLRVEIIGLLDALTYKTVALDCAHSRVSELEIGIGTLADDLLGVDDISVEREKEIEELQTTIERQRNALTHKNITLGYMHSRVSELEKRKFGL